MTDQIRRRAETEMTGSVRSSFEIPLVGAAQEPGNRAEQLVVYHLLHGLTEDLTDRNGHEHSFPWNPDQNVRIGVLGPRFVHDLQVTGRGTDDGDEGESSESGEGVEGGNAFNLTAAVPPIDNTGVIGIDFVVAGQGGTLELAVEVDYALYHPVLPDYDVVEREANIRATSAAGTRRRPRVPVNANWRRDNRHVSAVATIATPDAEFSSEYGFTTGDPFERDARDAVRDHYEDPRALCRLQNNQTIDVNDAMGGHDHYLAAVAGRRNPDWVPAWPIPRLEVSTIALTSGEVAVSVSLLNALETTSPRPQDLAMYDVRLAIRVGSPWELVPQRLHFADDDVRYAPAATVVGRGRGCVAIAGDEDNSIMAEVIPVYEQSVLQAVTHGADLRFSSLASDFSPTLERISAAMRTFHASWDSTADGTLVGQRQLEERRELFKDELDRFDLGRDLLVRDPRLGRAFGLANLAFSGSRGQDAAWRLFQLVFIVTELGALAGREAPEDASLRKEIETVDVLWFPTGGGKTEAYLGLILVALYFDRLRGKERGASAWLLFPLRMLSVQQLARVSEVLYHAEAIRASEGIGGDPFGLGYLVGAGNTPNRLARRDSGWWRGLEWFAGLETPERDQRRLVGACPRCREQDSVGLDADVVEQRVRHVCRSCDYELLIFFSDEEVTRYQPAVIVSTVDKLTGFSFNGELTAFHHGPRKRCPTHGWYSGPKCYAAECSVDVATHFDPTGFKDPVPSLWIQDELHLVRQELGVFAGHYHTLLAELARGAGLKPSKVIAATATIEQYEDQLRQVYGRTPRLFPVGGPSLRRSFYSEATDDVRRLFVGVLPSGGGTSKVDLATTVMRYFIEQVHRLMDNPSPLGDTLSAQGVVLSPAELRALLFDYELALSYVNSKTHGVQVLDAIQRLSQDLADEGSDRITAHYVQGETALSELASIVASIQSASITDPRAGRIRAMVGTAVISHGVDLDRLNFEVLAGMPSSYAEYIQATARAGRSHVGLVVSVFDRTNRRETSMFQSFMTTHAALERMVAPVPVNRYATRAVEKTLPGIVSALFWDETRNPSWGATRSISLTRNFQPWWDANAAGLGPVISSRIRAAYACPVPDLARQVDETRLVDDAQRRWDEVERSRMQQWHAEFMTELFSRPAMTSLRDVDPPIDFSSGPDSQLIVERLLG